MFKIQAVVYTTSSINCWRSTKFQCGYIQSNVCTLSHTHILAMRCENHVKSTICVYLYTEQCACVCLRHYVLEMALECMCARLYLHTLPFHAFEYHKCKRVCLYACLRVCMRCTYTGNLCWKTKLYLNKNLLCKWQWKGFDFSFHIFVSRRLSFFIIINRLNWHSDLCKFVWKS